jgi:hypothetical protein
MISEKMDTVRMETLMTRFIIIFIIFTSNSCFAEELTAVLDLKFIKDTGITSGVMCYRDEGEDCHTWSTFYLYDAKVRKVISGELSQKKITVIYGRHALLKNNRKNVVVRLKQLRPDAEAQYQIIEFGVAKEMVCFESVDSRQFSVKLEVADGKFQCIEELKQ